MEDIIRNWATATLIALLNAVTVIVGAYTARWVRATMERQRNPLVKQAAEQAVKWVEQTLVEAASKDKFKSAAAYLAKQCKWLDADEVEKAIEAAVYDLNAGPLGAA